MIPHLLRCQGFAVANYSFTLGRLAAGAPLTFAQLGYQKMKSSIDGYHKTDETQNANHRLPKGRDLSRPFSIFAL